jgi:hypothetical protein
VDLSQKFIKFSCMICVIVVKIWLNIKVLVMWFCSFLEFQFYAENALHPYAIT